MTDTILPDWDDMTKVIEQIESAMYAKLSIDSAIEMREAEITKLVSTNPDYFVGGKPPSMEYVKKVYLPSGLEGELKEMRMAYADSCARLKKAELTFDMMKSMIDVWRTEQSNQRKALL
jgi:hypothetical protein